MVSSFKFIMPHHLSYFFFQIETEHLFGNISDVLTVNCDFWESHLLKVLVEARENRMPLNPSDMKDGFKKVIVPTNLTNPAPTVHNQVVFCHLEVFLNIYCTCRKDGQEINLVPLTFQLKLILYSYDL